MGVGWGRVGRREYKGHKESVRGKGYTHFYNLVMVLWVNVGKTTRPLRYNLNQILYDYTVEVTNRFKGLDLIDCLKNYGQRFLTLYSCVFSSHLFLISSASVRSIPFLSFMCSSLHEMFPWYL